MEKDTKTVLLAVLILFIAVFSFKFVDLTGNIVGWELSMLDSSKPTQPACTDTDKGYNFGVQGVCYENGKEKGRDKCNGNIITEYYCSDSGAITGRAIEDVTGEPIVGWDLGLLTTGKKCYSKTFDCSTLGKGYKCGYGGVCAKLGV